MCIYIYIYIYTYIHTYTYIHILEYTSVIPVTVKNKSSGEEGPWEGPLSEHQVRDGKESLLLERRAKARGTI